MTTAGLALLIWVGCSGEQMDRLAVKGTVTHDAEPVARGSISFLPAEGTDGPAATTGIVDGKYAFDKSNGPVVGSHQVVIILHTGEKSLLEAGEKPTPSKPVEPWTGVADVSAEDIHFDFDIAP